MVILLCSKNHVYVYMCLCICVCSFISAEVNDSVNNSSVVK